MKKIQLKQVTITRAEGPSSDCGRPGVYKSFTEANGRLRRISETAPKTGGYDKTDVVVEWEDGQTYTGRWDVKHHSQKDADLSIQEHIQGWFKWVLENPDKNDAADLIDAEEWLVKYSFSDEPTEEDKMKTVLSKVLADYTWEILQAKKEPRQAFESVRESLVRQTGIKPEVAANLVRMSIGLYLGEKEYFQGAFEKIVTEVA